MCSQPTGRLRPAQDSCRCRRFRKGCSPRAFGARGERAKALKAQAPVLPAPAQPEPVSEFARRAKTAWARLIGKVYEADPLQCPKCKGPMRVIALIDDPGVIRRILEHLGLWAPEAPQRGPPAQAPEWPANALIPLTYHPLPDIA